MFLPLSLRCSFRSLTHRIFKMHLVIIDFVVGPCQIRWPIRTLLSIGIYSKPEQADCSITSLSSIVCSSSTVPFANHSTILNGPSTSGEDDRFCHLCPSFRRAMNFGSLAVLLAQKLFASIDFPEGRTHLANGTRVPSWWSAATNAAYNTSRQCMNNYYTNEVQNLSYDISGVTFTVRLQGEPFSPTTLRHIGALRFAYNALIKTNALKGFRMPGTNLTGEQTFFLAYGQTQCYQRQTLTQYFRTQLGIYDERIALNAALIHMPEFADAFQCAKKENSCF